MVDWTHMYVDFTFTILITTIATSGFYKASTSIPVGNNSYDGMVTDLYVLKLWSFVLFIV